MKAIHCTAYGPPEVLKLREMLIDGRIKPVIDRTYTLEEIPEAHRYLDSGQRKGNLVALVED